MKSTFTTLLSILLVVTQSSTVLARSMPTPTNKDIILESAARQQAIIVRTNDVAIEFMVCPLMLGNINPFSCQSLGSMLANPQEKELFKLSLAQNLNDKIETSPYLSAVGRSAWAGLIMGGVAISAYSFMTLVDDFIAASAGRASREIPGSGAYFAGGAAGVAFIVSMIALWPSYKERQEMAKFAEEARQLEPYIQGIADQQKLSLTPEQLQNLSETFFDNFVDSLRKALTFANET